MKVIRVFVITILLLLFAVPRVFAETNKQKAQELIVLSNYTFEHFMQDPNFKWFRDNLRDAKGLLICPQILKGAFFIGGSGGNAVLIVKNADGSWSQPAFYTLGGISFGFQWGGQSSEIILMIQSQKGIESLYSSSFKLGADASVAVGPVGAGMEGSTAPNLSADYLSFARAKGAFIGVALDGTVISFRESYNTAYYGSKTSVRPVDILVEKKVSSKYSNKLIDSVANAVK